MKIEKLRNDYSVDQQLSTTQMESIYKGLVISQGNFISQFIHATNDAAALGNDVIKRGMTSSESMTEEAGLNALVNQQLAIFKLSLDHLAT